MQKFIELGGRVLGIGLYRYQIGNGTSFILVQVHLLLFAFFVPLVFPLLSIATGLI